MKKLLLTATAAMIALVGVAQNKAIDALAEKYSATEGFTVVNLAGDMVKSISGMIPRAEGSITLDDGTQYSLSELLNEIALITAVVNPNGGSEEFFGEVRRAVASGDYTPLVSHNADGQTVSVSSAEIRRGEFRKNQEIVVMVAGGDATVLVRLIGKIDTALLARILGEMQKS